MSTTLFILGSLAGVAIILSIAWYLDDKGREQAKAQWRRLFWSKKRLAEYDAQEIVPVNSRRQD